MMPRTLLGSALLLVLSCASPSAVAPAVANTERPEREPPSGAGDDRPGVTGAATARAILARADLAPYHGWVRYLELRAERAADRFGPGTERARQDREQLDSWTRRILEDPGVLSELRGVFEWAYLSEVDGSGQPFKLHVPTDYDPSRPAPLSLYMHGYSGNHLEHSTFMQDHPGAFEVAVLGRSRGGRYRALSEADVLAVLDYVAANWSIDRSRVHLTGGSMGGGGTFWLGSRYPHRFASGRPVCGYASDVPVENLLTFPIYATHSDDDWIVPVLHSRGPLQRLKELGGPVVYDETTGLGHAAWNYTEGNRRAEAWHESQVCPPSRSVKRLVFTALDGVATRSHWAQIGEWGPLPAPARFELEVGRGNELSARLRNVTRLDLDVPASPLDASAPLVLSIEGRRLEHPAPLPSLLSIERRAGAWAFGSSPAPAQRLHTPGGANQLYDGSPLLIVYGTTGGAEARAALERAAVVASRSSSASWPSPNGEIGDDGVSHNQNLYGELRIEADVRVTEEDLRTHHLVLLGTASQNSLVARLADRLPVRWDGAELRFSDGLRLPAEDTALGLVFPDPLAPTRLIFWVASEELDAYRPDALVPQLLGTFPTGVDFVATRVSEPRVLLVRSFDSRWAWVSRDDAPALPAAAGDRAGFARLLAEAARTATTADFAFALDGSAADPVYAPASVRWVDVAALFYHEPIGVMTLTGAELAATRLKLTTRPGLSLQPEPGSQLDPRRSYRVALSARQISPVVATTHLAPTRYRLTEHDLAEALLQSGGPER